ncbi:MAG: hypothetical protein Q8R93_15905 [Methylicorpusculum sp.]|nr:hypothetical protein [Methylicorpusculum sp.]
MSANNCREENAATPGFDIAAAIKCSKQSGTGKASGLSKAAKSVSQVTIARLFAAAKPQLTSNTTGRN